MQYSKCTKALIKRGVTKYRTINGFVARISGEQLHNDRTTYTYSKMEKAPILLNEKGFKGFLDKYDTFMLDCDGTLWGADHLTEIPGIDKAIELLNKLGKRLIFVTNNSIHSNYNYKLKFQKYGFDSAEDNIFGVAYATAVYLKDIAKIGDGLVYLVGSPGMATEFTKAGINFFGSGPDFDKPSCDPADLLAMEFRESVKAVVVGYDEHFHYNKLYKAASYIQDTNCLYIASNDVEISFPLGANRMQPVTGTLVKAVSMAAKKEPVVVGKPHSLFLDCVMKKHPEIVKDRTIFVGDSLKADIAFGTNVGIDSLFVLTGTHNLDNLNTGQFSEPTYILNSLADIVNLYDK